MAQQPVDLSTSSWSCAAQHIGGNAVFARRSLTKSRQRREEPPPAGDVSQGGADRPPGDYSVD
eukprot:7329272-Pyramimonas_sp.AAC.1